MNPHPLALLDLQEQEEALVHSITGGASLISRLAGMGIVAGARLRVLQAAGGRRIVQVGETRIALGHGEVSRILVRRVPPAASPEAPEARPHPRLLVALAGQPNVGKSTMFNILTGLSQHVGNWPGKTVEKKEGVHETSEAELRIVDLPGTYSLTAFSEEERVARDFLISAAPDVIVLVVNAAALERSLYLLTELLLLGPPVLVVLNMTDVAREQGIEVNCSALERSLGLPVVPVVATRNEGIREVVEKILSLAAGKIFYAPRVPDVFPDHRDLFLALQDLLKDWAPRPYNVRWVATKLMEGDPEVTRMVMEEAPPDTGKCIQTLLKQHDDALHAVVGGRYDWIEAATRAAVSRFRMGQVVMTDRLDHALTRPLFGIPILLVLLGLVFGLTYGIGFPVQQGLEWLLRAGAAGIGGGLSWAPEWLRGLLIDGVIGGVGSVLTFVPILLVFFACLAFLEDVGYMARAAFVMDRFMHVMGLHGKSFIPLCLGFGCNVPAVMGARIIESKPARLLTVLLAPFVPCTARLAVLSLVAAAVFGAKAAFVSWGLLSLNLLVLGIVGTFIGRVFLRQEPVPFIMELPLYHRPDLRGIGRSVLENTLAFVRKAGTVILLVSVVVWFLSFAPAGRGEESLLSCLGQWMAPLGRPLGLDWTMMTALLTSVVAKENALATLAVLHGTGEEGLVQLLPAVMAPASALSFLVFLMLIVPCAPTLAIMRREMGDWRWFLTSQALMLALAYGGGWAAFRLATWAGL